MSSDPQLLHYAEKTLQNTFKIRIVSIFIQNHRDLGGGGQGMGEGGAGNAV